MIELRRYFPGIVDNENARRCARTIASTVAFPTAEKNQNTLDQIIDAVMAPLSMPMQCEHTHG